MRPRVFPAEDAPWGAWPRDGSSAASMRPRVFPAEDERSTFITLCQQARFNEAAGIPRGRPTRQPGSICRAATLQ